MITLESESQFNDLINNGQAAAFFSADWCPDCRIIEPDMPEIEEAYPNVTFIAVDRDQFIDLCQQYDIFGIPSFVVFKNGTETGRFVSKDRKTKEEVMAFMDRVSD